MLSSWWGTVLCAQTQGLPIAQKAAGSFLSQPSFLNGSSWDNLPSAHALNGFLKASFSKTLTSSQRLGKSCTLISWGTDTDVFIHPYKIYLGKSSPTVRHTCPMVLETMPGEWPPGLEAQVAGEALQSPCSTPFFHTVRFWWSGCHSSPTSPQLTSCCCCCSLWGSQFQRCCLNLGPFSHWFDE